MQCHTASLTPHTTHSTLHTASLTLYTAHYTHHTESLTLYKAHCTPHTVSLTAHKTHCTVHQTRGCSKSMREFHTLLPSHISMYTLLHCSVMLGVLYCDVRTGQTKLFSTVDCAALKISVELTVLG